MAFGWSRHKLTDNANYGNLINASTGGGGWAKQLVESRWQLVDTWTVALWCKVGGHSFDPDDPDKHSYTETKTVRVQTGNSYGSTVYQDQEQVASTITMCGPCYNKQRPFQDIRPEIPAGVDKQTYLEYLESLNKIGE